MFDTTLPRKRTFELDAANSKLAYNRNKVRYSEIFSNVIGKLGMFFIMEISHRIHVVLNIYYFLFQPSEHPEVA